MVLGQAISELQDYVNEDISNEQKLRKMIATHIRYMIEEKETFNMIIKARPNLFKGSSTSHFTKAK